MMEFFNITLERTVLRCVVKSKDYFTKISNKGLPNERIFSDLSHRLIFICVTKCFHKHNKLPDKNIVSSIIERSNNKKSLIEKAVIVCDRIFDDELSSEDTEKFDISYDEICNLYEMRQVQEHMKDISRKIDRGDVDAVKQSVNSFNLKKYDDTVEEFEYFGGFKERAISIRNKREDENFRPLPVAVNELNVIFDGGVFKELFLIAGNSSTGKSAFLHGTAVAGIRAKLNGILFTIEMNKMEAANRIDSALTGISLNKFRNPKLNKFGDVIIRKWMGRLRKLKKKCGKLFIVSFLNGATTADIKAKSYEIMRREKMNIDFIVIDYLNDLKPIGWFKSNKDWDAQGAISWELHLMSRGFVNYDNSKGVAIVTANVLRGDAKRITSSQEKKKKRNVDERDIGLSKLVFHHSDIVCGIIEVNDDINQVIVMKNRGGKRGDIVNSFQNFKYGRFHDPKLAFEKMNSMKEVNVESEKESSVEIVEGD
jgi:replicative DNA helicase